MEYKYKCSDCNEDDESPCILTAGAKGSPGICPVDGSEVEWEEVGESEQ